MKWIILIGDEKFNINTIKSFDHYGCIECYDVSAIEGRYCVSFGEDHIFYDYEEDSDDYEDDINKIPYANPHFITMVYTSKSCVRNVLQQDNFPNDIYIDNDCGLILPIEKFKQIGMPLDKDDMLEIL